MKNNIFVQEALKAPLEEASGCYIGQGKVVVESPHTTIIIKDAMADIDSIIKVPAMPFKRLVDLGVNTFNVENNSKLNATMGTFSAFLPVTQSDDHIMDIKIVDHKVYPTESSALLIEHLHNAAGFLLDDQFNPTYKYVYARERQVFATNKASLFVGILQKELPARMIFTGQSCKHLGALWKKREMTRAMVSSRSLLLKSADGVFTETHLVDGVLQHDLDKMVRKLTPAIVDVKLNVNRRNLIDALERMLAVSNFSVFLDEISLRIDGGSLCLVSANAEDYIPTDSTTDYEVSTYASLLLSAAKVIPDESLSIGTTKHFAAAHIALTGANSLAVVVATSIKEHNK